MTRRNRRDLSSDEYQLWSRVRQTATPLHAEFARIHMDNPPFQPPQTARVKPEPAHVTAPVATKRPGNNNYPAAFDRRTNRRLGRGREHIDARLDLHGQTQGSAHQALHAFLHAWHRKGARFVLIIIGKSGVLNRLVPLWLSEPAMRAHIGAVSPASPRHGGHGALYVRLKRFD